jgi:hypothetical protein
MKKTLSITVALLLAGGAAAWWVPARPQGAATPGTQAYDTAPTP